MNCNCMICKNNKPFEMPEDIIEACEKGNLVLFCGAGISTESKTVLPYSFYTSIADELQIQNPDLSFSEMMQRYCNQPNGRRKLLYKIRDRFQYIHSFPELERMATFFHEELSDLYSIHTILTTNWDTYFEQCCGALPITCADDFVFWDEHKRSVLKIHGSMDNLNSIVATSDDYNKCYEKLGSGIMGATLKNLLVTKTVVFIGFSFGDEDLSRIISYLRDEMGELYPHIYYVTLDENLPKRLEYKNSTAILTSGTFFIHKLKEILGERGQLINIKSKQGVYVALSRMLEVHHAISSIDLNKYACAIYTLAYQDGAIHSWERYLQNKTGDYCQPGYNIGVAKKYIEDIKQFNANKNYWDMSYFEGYKNGLLFIDECDSTIDAPDVFQYVYLPNSKDGFSNLEEYMNELERVCSLRSKYTKFAKELVKEKWSKEVEIHHPPY